LQKFEDMFTDQITEKHRQPWFSTLEENSIGKNCPVLVVGRQYVISYLVLIQIFSTFLNIKLFSRKISHILFVFE